MTFSTRFSREERTDIGDLGQDTPVGDVEMDAKTGDIAERSEEDAEENKENNEASVDEIQPGATSKGNGTNADNDNVPETDGKGCA